MSMRDTDALINDNICTNAGEGWAEIDALFAQLAAKDDLRRRLIGADGLDIDAVAAIGNRTDRFPVMLGGDN